MSRHGTISARHRTLLVYEGNQSHVIKNMAARVLHDTVHSQPCDQFFLLYPLMSVVVTSESVAKAIAGSAGQPAQKTS